MVYVIATVTLRAGARAEYLASLKANVPTVLAEDGCIEYTATADLVTELPAQKIDDDVITIVEKWESLPALEAHLIAPHMRAYKERVKDLVEDVSLRILQNA